MFWQAVPLAFFFFTLCLKKPLLDIDVLVNKNGEYDPDRVSNSYMLVRVKSDQFMTFQQPSWQGHLYYK